MEIVRIAPNIKFHHLQIEKHVILRFVAIGNNLLKLDNVFHVEILLNQLKMENSVNNQCVRQDKKYH